MKKKTLLKALKSPSMKVRQLSCKSTFFRFGLTILSPSQF